MKKDIQFLSGDEILKCQSQKLREEIEYISKHCPYYKKKFIELGIDPKDVSGIEDLHKLPITTKQDLQLNNDDFISVDKAQIVEYLTTSGTLGDPVICALTNSDLERLALNEMQSFTIAGITKDDTIQLMTTADKRFMAGIAYYLGSRAVGSSIIRVGGALPALQWDTINRISPNVAIVVPSFIVKLIEYAKKNSIDYRKSSLKKAICIGEALRNLDGTYTPLGNIINKEWPELELYSTYASTEMQTSATECSCHEYSHIQPDLVVIEILDENNMPVEEGKLGEMVITTLGIRAMPLLRFKTGDMCSINSKPCKCGRNTMRISPIIGRKSHMIKYKGTSLYPTSLYNILDELDEVEAYIVEAYTGELGTDELRIYVSAKSSDVHFEKKLKDIFRAKVRVAPEILFKTSEYIFKKQMPESSRKLIKFIDLR